MMSKACKADFDHPLTVREAVIWLTRLTIPECTAAARRIKASCAFRGIDLTMAA